MSEDLDKKLGLLYSPKSNLLNTDSRDFDEEIIRTHNLFATESQQM